MTSSSPKRRPTTVSSDASRWATVGIACLTLASLACRARSRETLITYFNAEYSLSLRYPASWKTIQAAQEGVFYRNFLAPPEGAPRKPAVSVTLLVGPLGDGIESYARTYLSDNTVTGTEDDARPGLAGKRYRFMTSKGDMRYSLLLWRETGSERLVGLYSQGEASFFVKHESAIEEIERSLTLERPADYPRFANARQGFTLGVPQSWRHVRRITSGGKYLEQWASPALAIENGRQTIHASLTVSVEPIGGDGTLDTYHQATRQTLGESYRVLKHVPWRDGWLDVMRVETPMATSRVRRYYRAAGRRGYSLIFEARADVHAAVADWCDLIAATFKIGDETKDSSGNGSRAAG